MISDKIAKDRIKIFREIESKILYLNGEPEEWEDWQTASDERVINYALIRAINSSSDILKEKERENGK